MTLSVLAVGLGLGLVGCGSTDRVAAADGRIDVVTSFYPLEYAARRIGGDRVDVTNLTKPGAEPHDLELTPRQVIQVAASRLAIYEKGLQPAVDEVIAANATDNSYDISGTAHLDLTIGADPKTHGATETHASETHGTDDGHDHAGSSGTVDPHFWLDPVRYAEVAKAIGARLAELDPAGASTYEANTAELVSELTSLDDQYRTGLAHCRRTDLVTAHAAFGYLADRYGFSQVAIAGISPDAEPDPAALASIADDVRRHGITTIYTETLASPAIAQTVAAETGAHTAVLDPLEGITDASPGRDYLQVMRANLTTLRTGQGCS